MHTSNKIAKFYLEKTARGKKRWQVMYPPSMRRVFTELLPHLEGGTKKKVESALDEISDRILSVKTATR